MVTTDDDIVEQILAHEGPYSDHRLDPGGRTSWGISEVHHPEMWLDGPPSRDRAKAFYLRRYVDPFKDITPFSLKAHVVDIAVNSGILTARAMLANAARQQIRPVETQLVIERLKHYARIVRNKPSQAVFLLGWINRACAFLCLVLLLTAGAWASEVSRTRVRIEQMNTWDARGIQFYLLTFSDGTQATLSVDPEVPFAREVQQRLNQPLVLTLESPGLER